MTSKTQRKNVSLLNNPFVVIDSDSDSDSDANSAQVQVQVQVQVAEDTHENVQQPSCPECSYYTRNARHIRFALNPKAFLRSSECGGRFVPEEKKTKGFFNVKPATATATATTTTKTAILSQLCSYHASTLSEKKREEAIQEDEEKEACLRGWYEFCTRYTQQPVGCRGYYNSRRQRFNTPTPTAKMTVQNTQECGSTRSSEPWITSSYDYTDLAEVLSVHDEEINEGQIQTQVQTQAQTQGLGDETVLSIPPYYLYNVNNRYELTPCTEEMACATGFRIYELSFVSWYGLLTNARLSY